ncbi:MAG: methyl-accepting chemotaxis protein [Haloarculaceae archaeon]
MAERSQSGHLPERFSNRQTTEIDFDDEKLLDGISQPVVVIAKSGAVLAWNARMEATTGVDRKRVTDISDVRRALFGATDADALLAEHVLETPQRAHEQFDVDRADGDLDVYERTRTVPVDDRRCYYEMAARPLWKGGTVEAAVQTVQDRTSERRHSEQIGTLVSELSATIRELERGNLSARATFDGTDDVLDEETVAVVDRLNDMAAALESLVDEIEASTAEFETTVQGAARAAEHIDERVTEQTDLLATVAEETTAFSATMEEVAASTDQVAAAATDARDATELGVSAGSDADEATADVIATSEELVETVDGLSERMAEIEDIVTVIDDIADQTNVLALNASIEAARAGKAGEGFAVVADEIKDLANETSTHAEDIVEQIDALQSQTEAVVTAAEQSNEQIRSASADIERVLSALSDIADAVDEAATGITQIADVTDDQADAIEDVQSLVARAEDHTDHVAESSADIVAATQRQEVAITELSEQVEALTGDSGSDDRHGVNDGAFAETEENERLPVRPEDRADST